MSNPNRQVVRALIIEDNPADVHLIRRMLQRAAPGKFELLQAESLRAGVQQLAAGEFDIVLLDLGLPDTTGLASAGEIVRQYPQVPVVVLTGLDDMDTALQAVRLGVQDYWVKTELEGKFLLRTVRYAIERHRLLRALDETRQQQTRLKEQFLSHVSHELRSPLTSVHQFASILLDGLGGPLNREQKAYVNVVLRNATQLRAMIEDLLDVTRAETGKLRLDRGGVDLAACIRNSVADARPAAAAKGLTVSVEVPRLPLVYVDPHRVGQVLANLLGNAVKFTSRGGKIAIRAARVAESESVRVDVSDTGCGIEPETLPRVFDRLYQGGEGTESARKGLGLGLYICRELVKCQDGRIWAEGELGKGTTVSFTVPIFSLEPFLQPWLRDEPAAESAQQLVSVELIPAPKASRDTWHQARRRARWIIQRCVLPEREALLPYLGDCARRERVHVLARADGTKVLTERIRDQLQRSAEIGAALRFRVSAEAFHPLPATQRMPFAKWCKAVSDQLLERLRSMGERDGHGWTQDTDRGRRHRPAARLARAAQG